MYGRQAARLSRESATSGALRTPGQTAVWGSTGTRVGALFGSAREVGSREAPVAPGQPAGPRPPSPGKRQNAPSLASLGKGRNKQFWQNLIALDAQIATFGCFCLVTLVHFSAGVPAAPSMVGCQISAVCNGLWGERPPHPIGCRVCGLVRTIYALIRSQ